jgi:hypothetical protein
VPAAARFKPSNIRIVIVIPIVLPWPSKKLTWMKDSFINWNLLMNQRFDFLSPYCETFCHYQSDKISFTVCLTCILSKSNIWTQSWRHDTQPNDTQLNDIQPKDTEHKRPIFDTQHKWWSVYMTLSITMLCNCADCHQYAEHHI